MNTKYKLTAINTIAFALALSTGNLIVSSIGRSNQGSSSYLGAFPAFAGIFFIVYCTIWVSGCATTNIVNWPSLFKKSLSLKMIAAVLAITLGGMIYQHVSVWGQALGILAGFIGADIVTYKNTKPSTTFDYIPIGVLIAVGLGLIICGTPLYQYFF